jgi:hypothetical protein
VLVTDHFTLLGSSIDQATRAFDKNQSKTNIRPGGLVDSASAVAGASTRTQQSIAESSKALSAIWYTNITTTAILG